MTTKTPKISVLLSDDDGDDMILVPICKPKAPRKPAKITGYDYDCFPNQKPPEPLVRYLIDSVSKNEIKKKDS